MNLRRTRRPEGLRLPHEGVNEVTIVNDARGGPSRLKCPHASVGTGYSQRWRTRRSSDVHREVTTDDARGYGEVDVANQGDVGTLCSPRADIPKVGQPA